jgi:hypothetical protein
MGQADCAFWYRGILRDAFTLSARIAGKLSTELVLIQNIANQEYRVNRDSALLV